MGRGSAAFPSAENERRPVKAGAIGLDVGGTKCWTVLTTDGASLPEVVAERRTPVGEGLLGLGETLRDAAAWALTQAEMAGIAPIGIGIGLPGLVGTDGILRFAPHLPEAVGFSARALLEDHFGLPVTVDNDASLAALAEFYAIADSVSPDLMVMVTLGTGIGGGVVRHGRLEHGAHGFAGEFGHIVLARDGRECACGLRGCWETVASGDALGVLARERVAAGAAPGVLAAAGGDPQAVRGEHVTAAARSLEPRAIELVDEFARNVAQGLAGLINIFDPDLIVLGGGLADAADVWLEPVRRWSAELTDGVDYRPVVPIELALLGARAGALGAAVAVSGSQVPRAPVA